MNADRTPGKDPITYEVSGVDYGKMDPVKRLAQLRGMSTATNLERFGFRELERSRGESAYIWEEPDSYRAFVVEGLGTKNLVADGTREIEALFQTADEVTKQQPGGRTYYDVVAQDTVAMIVNDMIVVGAHPLVVGAYFAVGDSKWFDDTQRVRDLVNGWADACNVAETTYGPGETPTLVDIIHPNTIDLAGASTGIIKPKSRLILGDKLQSGDQIILVESSGIHANGLTLARRIKEQLTEGYATKLPDGTAYGEALLSPTHLYVRLVRELFESGVDIHYMVNVTGHGWRKLMRASESFRYVINEIPEPQPVFKFIQEKSGNDNREMYGNYNMGAGFAVYLPEKDMEKAHQVATNNGFKSWSAGKLEKGPKEVVIKPLGNLVFDELGVR